jgi:anti-sigma factor RsiW
VRTHEQYEELCAQVAVGRLSQADWAELEEHLETCAECRQAAGEFFRLGVDILPSLSHLYGEGRVPPGMKERFLARAQAEGLRLGPQVEEHTAPVRKVGFQRPAVLWTAWVVSIALAVLATAVALEHFRNHREQGKQIHATPQLAPPAATSAPDVARAAIARLTGELGQAQDEAKNAVKQLKIQREELESGKRKQAELESRIASLAQTESDLSQRNAQLAQLQQELSRVRADNEAMRTGSTAKDSQVNFLQSKILTLTTELEEERRLSIASNQARDMIVARNLHIVDIHDDEDGKRQRPFGRIFYIEGKELIFYAYDLTDSKTINAKITFYVWGERKGSERSVTKLGIIRSDDAKAGRWKLTFDDPQTLARIDSVFVTGESGTNTSSQPRGKRILWAYLETKANHP